MYYLLYFLYQILNIFFWWWEFLIESLSNFQFFYLFYRPNLSVLSKEATHLSNVIEKTSSLAEKVSSKVRELDIAKVFFSVLWFVYVDFRNLYFFLNVWMVQLTLLVLRGNHVIKLNIWLFKFMDGFLL